MGKINIDKQIDIEYELIMRMAVSRGRNQKRKYPMGKMFYMYFNYITYADRHKSPHLTTKWCYMYIRAFSHTGNHESLEYEAENVTCVYLDNIIVEHGDFFVRQI